MAIELKLVKSTVPSQKVIACLETALAAAKAGELNSVVVIGGYTDDSTSVSWAGVSKNTAAVIGATFSAATELATNWNNT